jgi:hypothetical protein
VRTELDDFARDVVREIGEIGTNRTASQQDSFGRQVSLDCTELCTSFRRLLSFARAGDGGPGLATLSALMKHMKDPAWGMVSNSETHHLLGIEDGKLPPCRAALTPARLPRRPAAQHPPQPGAEPSAAAPPPLQRP